LVDTFAARGYNRFEFVARVRLFARESIISSCMHNSAMGRSIDPSVTPAAARAADGPRSLPSIDRRRRRTNEAGGSTLHPSIPPPVDQPTNRSTLRRRPDCRS